MGKVDSVVEEMRAMADEIEQSSSQLQKLQTHFEQLPEI